MTNRQDPNNHPREPVPRALHGHHTSEACRLQGELCYLASCSAASVQYDRIARPLRCGVQPARLSGTWPRLRCSGPLPSKDSKHGGAVRECAPPRRLRTGRRLLQGPETNGRTDAPSCLCAQLCWSTSEDSVSSASLDRAHGEVLPANVGRRGTCTRQGSYRQRDWSQRGRGCCQRFLEENPQRCPHGSKEFVAFEGEAEHEEFSVQGAAFLSFIVVSILLFFEGSRPTNTQKPRAFISCELAESLRVGLREPVDGISRRK